MSLSLYCEEDDDDEDNLCCSPCCVSYQPSFRSSRCAPACKWLKQVNEHDECASCCCQEKYDCYDDCRNCLISCCPHTWKCCPPEPPCWKPPSKPKPMYCKPTACCRKTVKTKPCPKPSICSVVCKLSDCGASCDSLKGVVAVLFVMIVIIISFYINSKLPTERKTCCCIANLFK